MDAGHLFPCRVLMETSTERSTQTPMLLLGDIVLTLRFGNSLAMCWRLWLLSNGSKWKVPKAKSLPIKSLECYNTMQISPNLRRKKSCVKKMMGNELQQYMGCYEFPYFYPCLHLPQYSTYPFRHHQITLSWIFPDHLPLQKCYNAHRSQIPHMPLTYTITSPSA